MVFGAFSGIFNESLELFRFCVFYISVNYSVRPVQRIETILSLHFIYVFYYCTNAVGGIAYDA